MNAVVIDENVLIVAEKQTADEFTNRMCIESCQQALKAARGQIVVLDAADVILHKYLKQLKPLKRKGFDFEGSEFLIWLFDVQHDERYCERVIVTPLETSFEEVPLELRIPDAENKVFDLDDHIWLAAACASKNNPTILNATDSDWKDWEKQLQKHGFDVRCICQIRP
jgi:hypothetical protein